MLRGFHSWASERAGPDIGPWLLLSSCIVVQGLALVAIVGTVPVAFLNYAIVERPGMLAGRHLLARFADSPQAASTRNGPPGGGEAAGGDGGGGGTCSEEPEERTTVQALLPAFMWRLLGGPLKSQ